MQKLSLEKYALELKRLKQFTAKWQAFFIEKSLNEKQELVNFLKDVLSNTESVDFVLQSKEITDKIYEKIGEPFDAIKAIENLEDNNSEFNLDEAINPKEELNLENLCKELGLFEESK